MLRERKRNRWAGYDYSQNDFYYVTVCAKDRVDWFGQIKNQGMVLNDNGRIVEFCWNDLPNHNGPKFRWQKSFHDHVVRDESSLRRIQAYIQNNPAKWAIDRNNETYSEGVLIGDRVSK